MVGLFSRFSVSRNGHRRTQSALDQREVLPANTEETAVDAHATSVIHGIEVAVEFKPVERPAEPLDFDQPIQCPLPEPSILNDGRIWKERVSAGRRSSSDVIGPQEGVTAPAPAEPEPVVRKPRPRSNRMILPSVSAPEHNILKLLEECNASGGV
jgi:hypothetical protein